jgi:SAM-dependent methyltransferase
MNGGDHEYQGLVASSWDFLRGNTSSFPDRIFFREVIEQYGEPALIVGCGTGRLLLEYASDGIDVEGLDISPEMLEICKQKAYKLNLPLTLYTQGMELMELPRRYKSIVVPSSSFQLVSDLLDAQEALNRFLDHLQPEGILVMSVWHIQDEGDGEWGDWWMVSEKQGFDDEKGIRRWERSMYDPDTRQRHTENRYELISRGDVVYTEIHRRSPEMRNYSLSELTNMLEITGFLEVKSVSGFTSEPATDRDEVFCIFGRKG